MAAERTSVLCPGDWVTFDGDEHQVVGLAGTSVRLRCQTGAESVVLASYLMASPDFQVTGGQPLPQLEPVGLLDTLPPEARDAAMEWRRHVVEVETGLPPDAEPGAMPRPGFHPAVCSVMERAQAKADELGVSLRTVQGKRSRYAQQGLWGLVDQRTVRLVEATGRADARLVAAIRDAIDAETNTSTGTRSRLIRRVVKSVEAAYGEGVVPLPSRNTFCSSTSSRLAVTRSVRRSLGARQPTARPGRLRRRSPPSPESRSRSTPHRWTSWSCWTPG